MYVVGKKIAVVLQVRIAVAFVRVLASILIVAAVGSVILPLWVFTFQVGIVAPKPQPVAGCKGISQVHTEIILVIFAVVHRSEFWIVIVADTFV